MVHGILSQCCLTWLHYFTFKIVGYHNVVIFTCKALIIPIKILRNLLASPYLVYMSATPQLKFLAVRLVLWIWHVPFNLQCFD